ncbi:hypothetical protein ACPOL_0261 [Acidisarcina polymorpha]|uniref:Uncharacterized protein n=1 Tax=Acidisarcina polymorpha TaxID=2211140 RepID=A0A2Z5FT33_9BACT|nr:hypothetical protein ACPOL_0261 [Acidisarcina polymorpha]
MLFHRPYQDGMAKKRRKSLPKFGAHVRESKNSPGDKPYD